MASALTYVFLSLSVVGLWTPWPKRSVLLFYSLSVAMGLTAGILAWQALPAVALLAGLLYCQSRSTPLSVRLALKCLTTGIVILLFMRLVPGFHSLKVISDHQFAPDSIPFNMHLDFDKATAGLLLLLFCPFVSRSKDDWRKVLGSWGLHTLLCIPLLLAGSLISGYVRLDPKWSEYGPLWMLNNLLFVCAAEEAFFRGYIQSSFANPRIGLGVSSLLFGAAHYAGGWMYVVLAAAAGFFYGRAFQKSGKIEASILTHFSVNVAHFLFFSYPALIRSV